MLLSVMVATALAGPVPDRTVNVAGDFHGVAFDTPLRLVGAQAVGDSAEDVLRADALTLEPMARWVERSAQAVGLDDYGRLALVVTALDALPVRVGARRGRPRGAAEAVASGSWTEEERLLAAGGALRALGYATTTFVDADGATLLGVAVEGDALNVSGVQQRWSTVRDGVAREIEVEWALWDGRQRVGLVDHDRLRRVRSVEPAAPVGRPLRFVGRSVPAFALRRVEARTLQADGGGTFSLTHRPDAAAYLRYHPELHAAQQVRVAREEVRHLGLVEPLRAFAARHPDEVERVDRLLRTVQGGFTYVPGPVRSLYELVQDGTGDCDQLSLLLAAALLEVGYTPDDLVAVSWPDHLGLALRARSGQGPSDSAAVDLKGGRYHLLDVTHYVWTGSRLTSRWGRTSPEHGRTVTVVPLDG